MNTPRIRPFNRILLAIAALGLGALLVVPIWRIDLVAPQYPEGLFLQIFHDRFDGDVRNINGLNHYIGMGTIENEMFPEFEIMEYVFYLLIGWGLVAVIIGRVSALFTWLMALFAFVLWAMWDMYSWGYNYGHNLDPHAAIKIEGMAYQPPLFGHKKLLNFDAWSLPDTGGWILFAIISIAGIIWFYEWRWPSKKVIASSKKNTTTPVATTVAAIAMLMTSSCAGPGGAPEVAIGKVECASCRMTVVDPQFASAIVTMKGRTYAFDSPECMVQHVAEGAIAEEQVKSWWVCDHAHKSSFIDATKAYYLASPDLHSPMNGNVAGFSSEAERATAEKIYHGTLLTWEEARKELSE
ncbi:MAG: nitrous oxide reductase accessory protein NosL [Flavobacteriales bacterium]|nr:nitrous oxide reductase accessory protein NosL [Flavobacteriales bacterium]MBK6945679.1 nitrous oxide reductase accessory protein NosL [Flavobacteriales bacterium]MBK7241784.1 nitrous oxide reductase accessory protein NosL [Flavobacteriales bacterium]MBK9534768.1 nitrous oxide reductase accessory protein NosL [Flavobacteriales bacterium]MBP9137760.1 nitrous oxide reductase accessory protein NosL [Flavobacteriales bacterium]